MNTETERIRTHLKINFIFRQFLYNAAMVNGDNAVFGKTIW
ncbi:hypothetical protein ACFS07_20760 [Undibacterium arcticum]